MMKRNNFPFSAVLGLNHAKTAILIVLVNPRAGGLLISGPRGIGKSTLMRSTQELIERPWRDIPVSVTEDRLFGTIDTEKAIYSGQKKLYPGIINEADQGVLYLDDANLLREDLLDSILNIAEVGAYQLERTGKRNCRSLMNWKIRIKTIQRKIRNPKITILVMMERIQAGIILLKRWGMGVTMMNHHRICRNFRRGRMMKK